MLIQEKPQSTQRILYKNFCNKIDPITKNFLDLIYIIIKFLDDSNILKRQPYIKESIKNLINWFEGNTAKIRFNDLSLIIDLLYNISLRSTKTEYHKELNNTQIEVLKNNMKTSIHIILGYYFSKKFRDIYCKPFSKLNKRYLLLDRTLTMMVNRHPYFLERINNPFQRPFISDCIDLFGFLFDDLYLLNASTTHNKAYYTCKFILKDYDLNESLKLPPITLNKLVSLL